MNWSALLISLVFAGVLAAPMQESLVEQARSEFDAGKYADAVQRLTAALSRAPKDAAVNYWLARCYYEQRQYDTAIKHAEAAVTLSPDNADYHRWLGRIYGGKAEQSHSF